MNENTRRQLLLRGASALALVGAVSACATTGTGTITLAPVIAAVQVLGAMASEAAQELDAINPPPAWLTAAVMSTVTTVVGQIEQVANQLSAVTTTASAEPLLQQLETYVQTFVTALSGLPLPPQILMYVQIAAVVMPLLFALLNMVVPTPATMQASEAALEARAHPKFTPHAHAHAPRH